MEPVYSIPALCRLCRVTIDRLHLPCLFCHNVLSLGDLYSFMFKDLNVVIRGYRLFACCVNCLLISANYEMQQYYQCTANASTVQCLTRKSLLFLYVRCDVCMKPLSATEKFDCLTKNDEMHLVRSIWRGTCRLCRKK
ncbi:E6 [Human papillomavirus 134]|uniref:Protein E6 n=1 Tax=Human papillomavirus 134 TaxID=909333 RepID=E7BQA7_9PAPI|nr:E6 [Human papillomavirus 134]ADQ85978.1 E6 [Human papillomavirus 134]